MSNTYTLAADLVQAIVNNLNSQPAASTRGLLNAIESECTRQDQLRAEEATSKERAAMHAEVKAEILASQRATDEVQAPAQVGDPASPPLPPING